MTYHVMFEDLTNGIGSTTPIICDTVKTITEARRLVRKLYSGMIPFAYYYVEWSED
jgi:hypothetical protein